MNQKKGLMPIILLLIFCLVLSAWVIKNVPVEKQYDISGKEAAIAAMKLDTFDFDALFAEGKPVLLNVSSDDCPYCIMMEPELAEIYMAYKDIVTVCDVNMNEHPGVTMYIPVRGTPMQVFYNADGSPYEASEAVRKQINLLYYVETGTENHVMTVHEGMMTAPQMQLVLQDMGAEV